MHGNRLHRICKDFQSIFGSERLKIINMLSNGELCACKILEEFQITQPTLSHDMKLLTDMELVVPRKEGKWTHYSLNREKMNEIYKTVGKLMIPDGFQTSWIVTAKRTDDRSRKPDHKRKRFCIIQGGRLCIEQTRNYMF